MTHETPTDQTSNEVDTAQRHETEQHGVTAQRDDTEQHGDTGSHRHGYISSKDDYLRRLKRIEGQARGLQRMVDDEQYCIDIVTQVSAMTKALQSVAIGLLEDHLQHCVADAIADGGDPQAKVQEAAEAIARLVRS